MKVEHSHDSKKGEFFILDGDKKIASLFYIFAGETKIIIEHTVVDPSQEGKGLGKQLVNATVEFARKNGIKIMPLCPYAKRVLEGSDTYNDVLF
ncbi:MAG: N-acetyltransferase [Bacteroidia bacterium]|nr:N-acetyltransferase [Bacteroidia bacterium]